MYANMNMNAISVDERIFVLVRETTYGGKRFDSALNKLNLEYRKGKSHEDVMHAKQLSFSRNKNENMFLEEYANRLKYILKSK